MKKGKEKCEILKAIRTQIAQKYGLDYTPSVCNNDGDCIGTCPKCEAELADLQRQLEEKAITDITLDKSFEELADNFSKSDDQDDIVLPEQQLAGQIAPPDEFEGLEGDIICPPDEGTPVERKILVECPVAGIGFHDIEEVWDELYEGAKVSLIRESDNPHDKNAVAVALSEDTDDPEICRVIGYIPRKDNKAVAALIDMGWGKLLEAEISEKNDNASYSNRLHISVYVKNQEEVKSEDDRLHLMVFSNQEDWDSFTDDLWKDGYSYFRWGGFPPWELDLPEKGDKVVFLHSGEQESSMYLVKTIAIGIESLPYLKNKEELYYVDDCTTYVVTNVCGKLTVDNEELSFLEDFLAKDHWQPDTRLSKEISEKLIELFR